ncbi:hypothetical protein [Nocardia sp. NPDC057668]|uniref:hypothetical protein n=1 Tax=Nocardia sp. NPDC057668 TaxID=3346202 RepID=UPI00367052A8
MTVETALARAAAPALGAGARGVYRRIRPDVSLPALRAHAEELAEGVRRRERSHLDHLGVTAGEEIPRALRVTARHDDVPGSDRITNLGGYFAALPARRLLILGDPGSGKTVAAAQLVLRLLALRPADADRPAPVPVRVDASSWDPELESFTWFLVRRLVAGYRLHARVATELLAADLILPVLDGLDEIPAAPADSAVAAGDGPDAADAARAEGTMGSATGDAGAAANTRRGVARAVDRLNEPLWRGRPLVVLCRSADYRAVGGGSLFAMPVAELRGLRTVEIEAHLRRCCALINGDPAQWDPVFGRLTGQPRGVLAGALRSPARLTPAVHLLRVEGRSAAGRLAACADDAEVEALLFTALIDTAVAGEPPTRRAGKPRYSSAQVHTWLRTCARRGAPGPAAGGNIALGEIWRMAGARCRVLHAIAFALLSAVVFQGYSILAGPVLQVILGAETYAATTVFLRTQEPGSVGSWWGIACLGGVVTAVRPWSAAPRRCAPLPARWAEIGLAAGLVGAMAALGALAMFPPSPDEGPEGLGLPFVLTLVAGTLLACRRATARRAPGSPAGQPISAQLAAAGLVFGAFVLCERLLWVLPVADAAQRRVLLWAPLVAAQIWCAAVFLCAGLALLATVTSRWVPEPRPDELSLRRAGVRYWTPFLAIGLWLVVATPTATHPGALAALEVGWFLLVAWVVTGGGPWTAALLRYGCARLVFARGSDFTAHPAAFLAWCRRTGLLRVTGNIFAFRHDAFRRWLADTPPARSDHP